MSTYFEFGDKTEGEEVGSKFENEIRDKIILITGVSPNGLGASLAMSFASKTPGLLVLAGRDTKKIQTVEADLKSQYPLARTRLLTFDLANFASVRSAAAEVNAYPEAKIDILINNAGVMNIPERTLSDSGFEMHLATNYLGLFLFTNSIMGKLLDSGETRIVNISSNGFHFSPFRFADYNFEGNTLPEDEYPPKELCESYGLPWGLGYLPTIAYGQSKTAVLLYSVQLAKFLFEKGITSICVHPGAIKTEIWRHIPKESAEQLFSMMPMKSVSQGISTILVAALDPKLTGSSNVYLEDCQAKPLPDSVTDTGKAERLWVLTQELVGKTFQF